MARKFERLQRSPSLWKQLALPELAEDRNGFAAYFDEQTIVSMLIAMPITVLLHLFMIWLGVSLFPEQKFVITTYHLGIAFGSFLLFLLARSPTTAVHIPVWGIFAWMMAATSAGVALNILQSGIFLYIGSILFTLLYICGIVRTTFVRSFFCCVSGILSINLIMIICNKQEYIEYIYANSFMIYACVIGLTMSYTIERLERLKYILQKRLERERATADDYSRWLRQLAAFLRHEVRQPIAQINSSIELATLKRADDPARNVHLQDATNAAQHVWHLIERASRATDAEAFVRGARVEPVELRGVLEMLVAGFLRTYSGVGFQLQASADVTTQADPVLFKEAVSNLLSNAASYADEESVVEVSLRVHDRMAVIKVRNRGPRIEGEAEELFQPFASSRSGSASEHHGLGLYLVRLIAQQHGGTATIGNTRDNHGVEACMRLPVKALT